MILRLLLWNLADSKTSLDEVRSHIAASPNRTWISDETTERFGVVELWEDEPGEFPSALLTLIGKDPEIADLFDVEP